MKAVDLANQAHEELSRVLTVLPEAVAALTLLASPLRGASYDSSGGTVRCLVHGRSLKACYEHDAEGCEPDSVPGGDPTGEAAANAPSESDMRRLLKALNATLNGAREAASICAKHRSAVVTNDRAGIGTCQQCLRYCTGEKNSRLSNYRGTGDFICGNCRKARDRAVSQIQCASVLTHEMVDYHCSLAQDHGGKHKGDGRMWLGTWQEEIRREPAS